MSKMRSSSRGLRMRALGTALLLGVGLTVVVGQSASAATSSFGYYMGASGPIYWFADTWSHGGGSISINPSDVPACGGYVNVGLWSPQTGSQFTNSLKLLDPSGSRTFTNASSGGTYIAPVGFNLDARRIGACGNTSPTDPLTRFAGTLTY